VAQAATCACCLAIEALQCVFLHRSYHAAIRRARTIVYHTTGWCCPCLSSCVSSPLLTLCHPPTLSCPLPSQTAYLPASLPQVTDSLLLLVGMSAAGQLRLEWLLEEGGWALALLGRLLACQEMGVAVLAAEVVCRVCDGDLDAHAPALYDLVPALLSLVRRHTPHPSMAAQLEGAALPLVFFSISALVRLTSSPRLARAIVEARGVTILTAVLTTQPSAICQVTTFALYRLVKAVDRADRSGALPMQGSVTAAAHSSSSSSSGPVSGSSSSSRPASPRPISPSGLRPPTPAAAGGAGAGMGPDTGPALPTPGLVNSGIKSSARTRPSGIADPDSSSSEDTLSTMFGLPSMTAVAAQTAALLRSSTAPGGGVTGGASLGDGAGVSGGGGSVIMTLARNGAFLKLLQVSLGGEDGAGGGGRWSSTSAGLVTGNELHPLVWVVGECQGKFTCTNHKRACATRLLSPAPAPPPTPRPSPPSHSSSPPLPLTPSSHPLPPPCPFPPAPPPHPTHTHTHTHTGPGPPGGQCP
jgi:hypothetical protein